MQAKTTRPRSELLGSLNQAIREATALGQMYGQSVAARLGLSAADLEYFDIITMRGSLTAGELAAATGRTTGAITGVIDRLEGAGFVRRERDPNDRRKVIVRPIPAAVERTTAHYRSFAAAIDRLADSYADKDIAMLIDYFAKAKEVVLEQLRAADRWAARRIDAAPASPRRLKSPRP